LLTATLPLFAADKKLLFEDRVEIVRGLVAEYGTAKTLLPRSRKALAVETNGTFDKSEWEAAGKKYGPAAKPGDQVQITKVDLGDDKIVLQINGGFNGGRKWYRNAQIGMGDPAMGTGPNSTGAAGPGGTTIELLFHKPLEPMKSADIKKMLAPVVNFEKQSVTETYMESLPPETQKAIKEKRVLVGMDREQVLMTLGRPDRKLRETKGGVETEDWIYGKPPGKITFVTFEGDKVIRVKDDYAGLGSEASVPPPPV
jgi:hypothetical protein